jgi:cation diffusion facilitator family transporter
MAEQERLAHTDHSHSHSHSHPHSHSHGFGFHHHHHHDNTYLVSKNKDDAGVKITKIGLYVNICMAISKGVGGYVFHSQALIADAVHSLADLISDVMTLATVTWSARQPTTRFPLGYGKIESIGSLGVSGLLLGGGVMMGWAAIVTLCQQFFPEIAHAATEWGIFSDGHGHGHGHSHSHSHTDLPNINAAWLAGGSIIIKEWLYRATLKVANERKSSVLASNAVHHRVDSLTAFVALLTIGGSNILSNAAWLDPVGGLAISTMVVQAGYVNTKQALLELADAGVDQEMKNRVERSALKALKLCDSVAGSDAVTVWNVTGMKSGQNYLMDLELVVPGNWSVEQSRQLEDVVRDRVSKRVRGVKRLRVRFATQQEVQDGHLSNEFVNSDSEAEPSLEANTDKDHEHDHDQHSAEHNHEKRGATRS